MSKLPNKLLIELDKKSYDFFGPATERILTAQIKNNLHKSPEQLTRQDIPKLADWLRLYLSAISSDSDAISDYLDSVLRLAKK